MPRIRSIKPKFWDDAKLAKVSRDARLLFIGIWNFADDYGVILGDPIWIKSKILPYDNLAHDELEFWIRELRSYNFIIPLTYNNELYYIVRTFNKHQRIDKPNKDDKFIENEDIMSIVEQSRNNLGTIADASTINPISIPHGEDRKGEDKDRKGEECFSTIDIPKISMPFNGEFATLWREWKDYRVKQHQFKYKSEGSEQAALHELVSLGFGKEETCVAIINQSMSNGWKGFFPIKNSKNGTGQSSLTDRVKDKFKKELGGGK